MADGKVVLISSGSQNDAARNLGNLLHAWISIQNASVGLADRQQAERENLVLAVAGEAAKAGAPDVVKMYQRIDELRAQHRKQSEAVPALVTEFSEMIVKYYKNADPAAAQIILAGMSDAFTKAQGEKQEIEDQLEQLNQLKNLLGLNLDAPEPKTEPAPEPQIESVAEVKASPRR